MKKQSIWVFEWRKSVHYWWSYISFSPECKELTSMLDPLLYRWGVPPVVIRCVHWTMQRGVLQTWIKALGLANIMNEVYGIHLRAFSQEKISIFDMSLKMTKFRLKPHPRGQWVKRSPSLYTLAFLLFPLSSIVDDNEGMNNYPFIISSVVSSF